MHSYDRRTLLRTALGVAGAGGLAACTSSTGAKASAGSSMTMGAGMAGMPATSHASAADLVVPTDPAVAAAEAARYHTGRTRAFALNPVVGRVDLGGPVVTTWSYGGVVPGATLRVDRGDVIAATLTNGLPSPTTVHWHGMALRNDMDGSPVTQTPVAPGAAFTYRFVAANAGTYWFHPHVGVQQDRGLYAPLIVDDPAESAPYDQDWTVVLDDWLDGTGRTPDQVLATLRKGTMNMGGMSAFSSPLLGGDAGDVSYPYYLVNGRVATAPRAFTAKPGQRARIRILNAGGDTAFRVALGGHTMTVTHTDGYPVTPAATKSLLVGMGERYDVLVTLADGVFPLVALAEGKNATALALVRTGAGTAPTATVRPAELAATPIGYSALKPAARVALPSKTPDVTARLKLTGGMMKYDWGINNLTYNPGSPLVLAEQGGRVRITWVNTTTMWHPMHLHGHTFQVDGGPRKDTVVVLPKQSVTCDLDADNPGQWMLHCHNVYHSEAGMMGVLGYRRAG